MKYSYSKSGRFEQFQMKDIYKSDYLMKIIYLLKKRSPNNIYFFLIFIILKFLGDFIISHNFLNTDKSTNLEINSYLRKFTYFNTFEFDNKSFKNYDIFSIIIFFLLIIPLISLFLIYKLNSQNEFKFIKISKNLKKILVVLALLINLLVIFSQHFIEILWFSFTEVYFTNYLNGRILQKYSDSGQVKENIAEFFLNFSNSLSVNKYVLIVMNSISIFLINFILVNYFIYMNEPFLYSNSQIKLKHNLLFLIFLMITFNFQGFHYFEFILIEPYNRNVKLILLIISLIINFSLILISLYNYNYKTFFNKILELLYTICFFSNLIEIIIYYTYKEDLTEIEILFKSLVELILSLSFHNVINNYKNNKNLEKLRKDIFSNSKKLDIDSINTFSDLLKNSLKQENNFYKIFKLIEDHKIKCIEENCICSLFNTNDYLKNFEINKTLKFKTGEEKKNKFNIEFHEIIILLENKIVNIIYQQNRERENKLNHKMILFHVDFLYFFKRNIILSNYLIELYSLHFKSLPFVYKFYFFVYKNKIIKNHLKIIKAKELSLNIKFNEFISYQKNLKKINSLVKINLENIEEFIHTKKNFNLAREKNSIESTQKIGNIEGVFKSCEDLNKNHRKLTNFLEKNYKQSKLENIENCYILYHYFILIEKNQKIPNDIQALFLNFDSYALIELIDSNYTEMEMTHPAIISLNKTDCFQVKYISQKLCDLIDYEKKELINEDIHLLIPESFREQHKLLIKKIVYLQPEHNFIKETYLITKQKYYFPVEIKTSFMPTLNKNTLLIMDLIPQLDPIRSIYVNYKFIVDTNSEIISYSKNFFENFSLNLKVFKDLKFNFGDFFNINLPKISQKFKKAIKFIEKIDTGRTNIYTKVFQNFDLEKSIKYLKNDHNVENKFSLKNKELNQFEDLVIYKKNLLPTLTKIKKIILEKDYEDEYMDIINEIEKDFYRQISTNEFVVNSNSMIKNSYKNFTRSVNNSKDFEVADAENCIFSIELDQFLMNIELKNVGNLPYFFINLYDLEEKSVIHYLKMNGFLKSNISWDNLNTINCDTLSNEIPVNSITDSSNKNVYKIRNKTNKSNSNFLNQNINFLNSNSNTFLDKKGSSENKASTNNFKRFLSSSNSIMSRKNIYAFRKSKNSSSNSFYGKSIREGTLSKISKNPESSLMENINDSKFPFFNSNTVSNKFMSKNVSINFYNNLNNKKDKHKNLNKRQERKKNSIKRKSITSNILNKNEGSNKEKVLNIILIIMIVIQLILSLTNIFLTNYLSNESTKLFKLKFYTLLTKTDVIYSSSLIVNSCTFIDLEKDKNEKENNKFLIDLDYLKRTFKIQANSLLGNLHKFIDIISESNSFDSFRFDETANLKFNLLYRDWSSYERNSNLVDELSFFHFYISSFQHEEMLKQCRTKEFFFKENFKNYNYLENLKNNKYAKTPENFYANFEENVFYYVVNNLFFSYKKGFDEILKKINLEIINNNDYFYQFTIIFYICCVIYALMVMFLIFITVKTNSKKLLKNIFNVFLNSKVNEKFEEKLKNFKMIVNDFDKKVCDKFEEFKMKNEIEDLVDIASFQESDMINNNNNTNKKEKEKEKDKEKNKKIIPEFFKTKESKLKALKAAFDQKNSSKENLNPEEKINENQEDFNYNAFDFGKISLKIVKYSYIILIIGIICYITFGMIVVINVDKSFQNFELGNQIAINFMERIPTFVELIIYLKISIILQNSNFVKAPQSEFNDNIFSNYYEIVIDMKSDSIFQELNESEYAELYYKIQMLRNNIHIFIKEKSSKNILGKIKEFENKINTKNFCLEYSKYYTEKIYQFNGEVNLKNIFIEINKEANECITIGEGINEFGLNLSLDSFILNMNNIYLDFKRAGMKNDIEKVLTEKNLSKAILDIEYTLRKLNSIINNIIKEDMDSLYEQSKDEFIIYSIIFMAFNTIIVFSLALGVIAKLKSLENSFLSALDKINIIFDYEDNINLDE